MPAETAVAVFGARPLTDLTECELLVYADACEETGDTEQARHLRLNAANIATSAREVAEWKANPPTTYFAYVKVAVVATGGRGTITTWMGDVLGACVLGPEWRDNFGGRRRSLYIDGNNGTAYTGTYFASAGDYCRIRRVKGGH